MRRPGHVLVEMVFLANVFVPCDVCGGKALQEGRARREAGVSSIHDVLEWTVDQALQRFHRQPRLARAFVGTVQQVASAYLRLGQPRPRCPAASTASEDRPRAGRSRAERSRAECSISSDEPTTGLHLDDVRTCAACSTADRCRPHRTRHRDHLDVVKRADWVIELGPGAGDAGGRVVAQGTPEDMPAAPILPPAAIFRDVA